MSRRVPLLAALLAAPVLAGAQDGHAPVPGPSRWTAEQELAAAVLALPAEQRAGATVMGHDASGKLVTLRRGSNGMTCFLPNPAGPRFQSACYHESLEPFMARGRELRASGVTGDQVDTVRFAEAKAGKLALPKAPAALWQLFGPPGSYDAATNSVQGGSALFVLYMPWATEASTGMPSKPSKGQPWLMFPGTPKAHVMFTPTM